MPEKAKLANAGLPVPGGFHITTEAYRQFVAANDLQAGINQALQEVDVSRPSTLETASATIGRLFARAPIPAVISQAIRVAYEELRPKTVDDGQSDSVNGLPSTVSVAVRSSLPPKTCRMHPSQASRRHPTLLP